MKIAIGSDHAGYMLKEEIKNHLKMSGHDVIDHGTDSEESTDYPDFAHAVAKNVGENEVDLGFVICGSANGVAMTANKHKDVRCAICWQKDIAELARAHNNANVAAFPSRFINTELAKEMTDIFIKTEFEGGRHARRVEKISC